MTDTPPEPKKKRAWFQLHLSTCVALMFVAGALVWANLVRSSWKFRDFFTTAGCAWNH